MPSTPPGGGVPDSSAQQLPYQVTVRLGQNFSRLQNLRCSAFDAFQSSTNSACHAGFISSLNDASWAARAVGTVGGAHINIDFDAQREFDASQTLSVVYDRDSTASWSWLRRVEAGNISFAPPASRYMTSTLPSGNYGVQFTSQIGRLQLKSIVAKQTGNLVQARRYDLVERNVQRRNTHETLDYQTERPRFFFTIDPALLRGYPNIDILNRTQLARAALSLPDTLRPTRVLLYRLQFGGQPQNPNGPRFHVRGSDTQNLQGTQTYDVLREGVDYYMDPSLLWFALVRPLNEANERLVVAYNVRINGRDTVWTTTGGTPDIQRDTTRPGGQYANLVMDPNVGPSSPAFRNEIRSVYRIGGEDVVRSTVKVRVVAGSGLLERPLAGPDATFLQMFGLAQPTAPSEFDYENRLFPRPGDPVFNLGVGAPDVRNGQSVSIAQVIRDSYLVFPSLRPFSARNAGLVVPGNPTNDQIYTIPGDYLNSPQHPASVYRLNVEYQSTGTDNGGAVSLDASQVRPGSEQLVLDGRTLVRDLDYRIDYDVGRIEFTRPDTVYRQPRHLEVKFEENPSADVGASTTLGGFVAQLPMSHGVLNFSAINQSQSNAGFNKPPLGFQGNSTLTTGVSGEFHWNVPQLNSLVSHLPFASTNGSSTPSRFSVQAEMAMSRPQFIGTGDQRAFLETFDAGGDIGITLLNSEWLYSSLPAYGSKLRQRFAGSIFETRNAATLVWQTNVVSRSGQNIVFRTKDIDPLAQFVGSGVAPPEQVLWLTLLPLDQVGRFNRTTGAYDWTNAGAVSASRRFRSIRTLLNAATPSGVDLTRGEHLEFWTLIDTSRFGRLHNGTLIFDFGDVSENSISFVPTALTVQRTGARVDSLFAGKRLMHFDTLDTERDPFSHTFNADVNDTGLPGDWVDTLRVSDSTSLGRLASHVNLCRASPGSFDIIGDPHSNCTIGNNRLDEEDIDFDNDLNLPSALRERERILRYIVDLSDSSVYKRIGGKFTDTLIVGGIAQPRTRQWVLVSLPMQAPTDSLNDVNRRRIRALRLTLVSGPNQGTEEPTQLPIANLRVTAAPWLNRSPQPLIGISGIQPDNGFVVTSNIGTNDSTSTLVYQPPPGVLNQAETQAAQFSSSQTQINEQSMRIQAGNVGLFRRAEAYLRFPSGAQDYLNYRQLRVWGRGRGNGWGPNGDLQMYVKLGRDENNFYMYRAPMNAGQTAAAWTDVAIDFNRFIDLRRQIQNAYTSGKKESIACTGVDSAIIAASPPPSGVIGRRFAACADGYMVYTVDPAVTAPNLGAVQELAVGILRVGTSTSPILPSDTLELWVDDIRLDRQVNTLGRAGQISLSGNIGDVMDLRLNIGDRDPNFRQMGEQPTFLGQRTTDLSATIRLDKLLPPGLGLSLPLTVNKLSLGTDPLYLSHTDVSARGIGGVRAPKTDVTTYSLTIRPSKPLTSAFLGPLVNNLGVTSTYVSGVDRTEFQDGKASNFSVAVDYLVTPDSARTADLPGWVSGALGSLPQILQDGPIGVFRATHFRWNPTQLRIVSAVTRGDDRRTSFLTPTNSAFDDPTVARASSRLWRNGSTLELRPTNGLTARWDVESVRDFRDYRDSSLAFGTGFGPQTLRVAPGFERERSILTSFTFAPMFSSWFRPRADFGTQFGMLRDPNVRGFAPLPGVIGVDSVLATRDTADFFRLLRVPRRVTAAQTSSVGSTVDIARAFVAYTHDSTGIARRIGGAFAPIDVSYTRSLLAAVDASDAPAPLMLQLGLRGPAAYRVIDGENATTSGQTGILSASSTLLLPFGTSFANRYRRAATLNWIERPDSSLAHVDGTDTRFPDATVQWAYRPANPTTAVASFDANVGYERSVATVSLPNLVFSDTPPQIRHTHAAALPFGANIAFTGSAAASLGARFSVLTQLDSMPGSVAHQRGNEVNFDAGRAFHVPESLGIGLKKDVRTRFNFNQRRTTTTVVDTSGLVQARLQDNGRQAFSITADASVLDNATFTMQGQYVLLYDNNLNHRTAQTTFTIMLQFQAFGVAKP